MENIAKIKYYRFTALSIFGGIFICLWRFLEYYLELTGKQDAINEKVTILIIACVLAALIWLFKPGKTGTVASIIFFILSAIAAFGFEKPIKNYLALKAGYFNKSLVIDNDIPSEKRFKYSNLEGNYMISLSNNWNKKTLSQTHDYFTIELEGAKAELRPTCFNNSSLVMPEIVNNYTQANKEKNNIICDIFQKRHRCLVKTGNLKLSRWHWLEMNLATGQNIDLDIVISNLNPILNEEINHVFASLEILTSSGPAKNCLSPIDWF